MGRGGGEGWGKALVATGGGTFLRLPEWNVREDHYARKHTATSRSVLIVDFRLE